MVLSATHFAPVPARLSRGARNGTPTVLSVAALAGVPALVRHAFRERVLRQANKAAMLDIELIEDQNCFIPHASMATFIDEVARRSGEANVGLLVAPHLQISSYCCWGDYVLGAETLGTAAERAIQAIGYHSQGDRLAVSAAGQRARISYASAARGREG